MVETYSFGYWVLRRRKALDLTREELARRVSCAPETIKKIERDERRPSVQIAELLANALAVPPKEKMLFLEVARGECSVDRLPFVSEPINALPLLRHNLPVNSTSFIGRQDEIDDLKARLENSQLRLCTILGPGGIGKTRLALQVAAQLIDTHPGGVWLVELASLSNPMIISQAISTVLGLSEQPNREFSHVLVD
jgi:transcriptional regulator with XRE-family HTH domain